MTGRYDWIAVGAKCYHDQDPDKRIYTVRRITTGGVVVPWCRHCDEPQMSHVWPTGKCLFMPTTYAPFVRSTSQLTINHESDEREIVSVTYARYVTPVTNG